MPATIFGNAAAALNLYQAFYGKAPANATFVNNVALAANSGVSALASAIGANFAATPAATLAKTVLTNVGIVNATLEDALTQIFTGYPVDARGQIVLNLTNLLSGLEGDATFGAAATAWNTKIAFNNTYSSVASNTVDSTPGVNMGQTFILTTGTDFADPAGAVRFVGAGNIVSDFKFSSANETVAASTATAQAADILADGSTTDSDTYALSASGASALGSISNIENFAITASGAAGYNITWTSISGAKSVTISGAVEGLVDLTNAGDNVGFGGSAATRVGATSIDASGLTGNAGGINYSLAGSTVATDVTVKTGGSGASTITTGAGNDTIVGAAGADTLNGGAGSDNISGGAGNDIIDGGSGNDTIDGGTGNNTITGGSGNDTIAANGTVDTIVFNAVGLISPNGKDTITGFDAGTGAGADILNVSAALNVAGVATAATALTTLTAAGAADFGGAVSTAANAVVILDRAQAISGQDYSSAADFAKVFGATSAIATTQSATAAHKLLVVQGTDQTQLYIVQADRDGTDINITANDVVFVGVLSDVTNTTAFAAGKFLV